MDYESSYNKNVNNKLTSSSFNRWWTINKLVHPFLMFVQTSLLISDKGAEITWVSYPLMSVLLVFLQDGHFGRCIIKLITGCLTPSSLFFLCCFKWELEVVEKLQISHGTMTSSSITFSTPFRTITMWVLFMCLVNARVYCTSQVTKLRILKFVLFK